MEIMHYAMRQLIEERLDEDKSFENFKEILLRHAIHRPPHCLAIFNLDDVKAIDLFALDTFYRHYDMYKYALTVQDQLQLNTVEMFIQKEPVVSSLVTGQEMAIYEVPELMQFLSESEKEAIEREKEYRLHGPGRIETIIDQEMEGLMVYMKERMNKQDEDFIAKNVPQAKR